MISLDHQLVVFVTVIGSGCENPADLALAVTGIVIFWWPIFLCRLCQTVILVLVTFILCLVKFQWTKCLSILVRIILDYFCLVLVDKN